MSEYVMKHTGGQLDDAIDKVLNDYIKPEGTLNITEKDNNTEVDVTKYALAKVQIPIPTFTTEEIVINPTESTITKQPTVDGFSKVTVNPISSTYIGSGVARKSGETFTPKKDVQQVIPSGRYLDGNQIIDKIPDEYIIPNDTITVDKNTTTPKDVTNVKWLNVSVNTEPVLKKLEVEVNISSNITASSSYSSSSVVYSIPSDLGFTPKFYLFSPYDYKTSRSNIVATTSYHPVLTLSGVLDESVDADLGGMLEQGATYYEKKGTLSYSAITATLRASVSIKNSSLKFSSDKTKLYFYNSSSSTSYPIVKGKWRLTLIGW